MLGGGDKGSPPLVHNHAFALVSASDFFWVWGRGEDREGSSVAQLSFSVDEVKDNISSHLFLLHHSLPLKIVLLLPC